MCVRLEPRELQRDVPHYRYLERSGRRSASNSPIPSVWPPRAQGNRHRHRPLPPLPPHLHAGGREERILFTYPPFSDPTSVPAPGPVFIHAIPCERFEDSEIPPTSASYPCFSRATVPAASCSDGSEWATSSRRLRSSVFFTEVGADYVHIRNAEAGCFMARVDPIGARSAQLTD